MDTTMKEASTRQLAGIVPEIDERGASPVALRHDLPRGSITGS
jgi:hypothetical protein